MAEAHRTLNPLAANRHNVDVHRYPLTVDGHLDLASAALAYDRDLRLPLDTLRQREANAFGDGDAIRRCPGTATVSLPAMRDAGVNLCVASIIARVKPRRPDSGVPRRDDIDFHDPVAAEASALAQLAWYRGMERHGALQVLETADDLTHATASPHDGTEAGPPLHVVLMLEGCDPIVECDDAAQWHRRGVRVACLAHYGQARYGMGTGGDGPLTDAGRRLVPALAEAGIALDLSHTADTAVCNRFAE